MNSTITKYIKEKIKYPLLIEDIPADNLNGIIVIPCSNESKILETVRSIYSATSPGYSIEIIVVIFADRNSEKSIHSQNILNDSTLNELDDLPDWCKLYVIMNNNFRGERANSNFAAKIGMDDSVRRFSHMDNENGLIIRHPADQIVKKNYFVELRKQSSAIAQDCLSVIEYCKLGD